MSKPDSTELDRHLVEVRGRMSWLRALLTARPNPPDVKADRSLELEFYSHVEKDLQAQLQLRQIDNTIREMQSMIAGGLSAVASPSFRIGRLRLYDEPIQREKLRAMIEHNRERKALLQRRIDDWKTGGLHRWQKVMGKIERRYARRGQIRSPNPATTGSMVPRRPDGNRRIRGSSSRSREIKIEIAELKTRHPKAPSREICQLLDALIERGKKILMPLESWQKKADGRRTWIELYDDRRTNSLVRRYINGIPALLN